MKKILSFFLFFLLFFVFYGRVLADTNFSSSYSAIYDVLENEITKVTLNISIRNKTSNYYASSYTLLIGFKNIESIGITDSSGNVSYKTDRSDKGNRISFNFNKNVVGINEVQAFTVYFETKEVAKNFGSLWEVNIPGVLNQEEYSQFNVEVKVPKSFGSPTFIKPSVKNLKTSDTSLFFSRNDLGESGISIAYGKEQIYEFNLTYHLQNKNLFPIQTEIAIPSNNNYQEVQIESINPKPSDVYIDNDGNWLAKFYLPASKKQNVKVDGAAKIAFAPKKESLSESKKKLYLKPVLYWEQTPQIKKLGKSLKTPEEIYRYVVNNLTYDPTRVKETQIRAGALGVLNNKKSAVCLEFTDLFIALTRAAGIPARAVEGYANTSNSAQRPLSLLKDVLHSWPEFYDFERQMWIMVDPTWENTTQGIDYFSVFDFDHFAFVIKGEKSDYPVSAGGYKFEEDLATKDVQVTTSSIYSPKLPTLTASTNFKEKYTAGFPIEGEIIISNFSGVVGLNQTFNVSSKDLAPHSQNLYFDKIPPFGKKSIEVSFNAKPLLTNERDAIKIRIGKETFETTVQVSPFYKNVYFILGGLIIGSIIIILSAFARRSRRVSIP